MRKLIAAAAILLAVNAQAGWFGLGKGLGIEDVEAAESCLSVTRYDLKEPLAMNYPELTPEVAEVIVAKGWMTQQQVDEVKAAGGQNILIGMTKCQVAWTMGQLPMDTKTYNTAGRETYYWHYDYGTSTVRFDTRGIVTDTVTN